MQRIERYGVIALVFLLVTIVAVSLWGERKQGEGPFAFMKRGESSARVDELVADTREAAELRAQAIAPRAASDRMLDLSEWGGESPAPHAGSGPADPYALELDPVSRDARTDAVVTGPRASILPQAELPASFEVQAPVSPAPSPRPVETAPAPRVEARSYTIRARDTLSQIAQRELGTSRRWGEIVELNPGLDPNRLVVGKSIRLPAAPERAPRRAAPAPREASQESAPRLALARPAADASYAVRPGDTLSEISLSQLGTSKRWREIVALNPGLNPSRLEVGQVITLPAPEASMLVEAQVASAASQPSASTPRRRVR